VTGRSRAVYGQAAPDPTTQRAQLRQLNLVSASFSVSSYLKHCIISLFSCHLVASSSCIWQSKLGFFVQFLKYSLQLLAGLFSCDELYYIRSWAQTARFPGVARRGGDYRSLTARQVRTSVPRRPTYVLALCRCEAKVQQGVFFPKDLELSGVFIIRRKESFTSWRGQDSRHVLGA
jgi:hypothetical protein